jgi:hypothetical protein
MPPKKRKLSNRKRSLESTPDQTNEDEGECSLNGSGTYSISLLFALVFLDAPMAVSARNSFKSTDDMRVMLQFDGMFI